MVSPAVRHARPAHRAVNRRRRGIAITLAALSAAGGAVLGVTQLVGAAVSTDGADIGPASRADIGALPGTGQPGYSFTRLTEPARTVVRDGRGATVAIFTDGARTVRLTGSTRRLAEPRNTDASVTTDAWVRLAPQEWREGAESEAWFPPWLSHALADRSPDVLAVAMEYVDGAESIRDEKGLQYAGDASFGPLSPSDPDGRAENSDFYDYLGVPWTFPDGKKEQPDRAHRLSLDCSGYLRMVYGYRLGYPLRGTNTAGIGLPRRAYAMAGFGPGVQLFPNRGQRATEYHRLQPGDLLFFNAGYIQGAQIEHSGIYLGLDSTGHHRFLSSRAQADGPTLGDKGGASLLDGNGYWAVKLRTARRI